MGFNKKVGVKASSQERILDSVVFNRDMDVGRQEGHQLQIELDLLKKTWSQKKTVTSISPLFVSFICMKCTFEHKIT